MEIENIQTTTADSTQTTVASAGIPAQSQTNVPVTGAVGNVTNTNASQVAGPDAAFAQMRRENEALRTQAAIAEDPEVKALLANRAQAKADAEAAALGVNAEAAKKFDAMDEFINQQNQRQFVSDLQANEDNFKSKFQMPQEAFDQFVGFIGQNYPEVTQGLQQNPSMDLSPYLAVWNPQGYSQFVQGVQTPVQTAKPVFVAGHGVGQTNAQADVAALQARIKERAKNL